MPTSPKPVTKKTGPRRVTTEPVQGQLEEPGPEPREESPDANRDRLSADKPPHY